MKPRKWTEEILRALAKDARSKRQLLQLLGLVPKGSNYGTVSRHLARLGIDTSHFLGHGWRKGNKIPITPARPLSEVLQRGIFYPAFRLKTRLIAGGLKPEHCEECGWAVRTADGHLPLEIHHLNGDTSDNWFENLQILCPNCHSLKPYYRSRIRKQNLE